MEIADGSRGTDLLRVMGASATEGILMIVNGCRRETMCEIEDGDKIDLVTPVAGG